MSPSVLSAVTDASRSKSALSVSPTLRRVVQSATRTIRLVRRVDLALDVVSS